MDRRSCRRLDNEIAAVRQCSCRLTGAPFEFHGTECDRAAHPWVDGETLALVEGAVESLVCLRVSLGDAGARVACLASLIVQAESMLASAVADALNQDYTWSEVAARLGVATSTARRRYHVLTARPSSGTS